MNNWRGVVGYEDYYKVSDTGEIWSIRSQRKLATPVNKYRGYQEWTPKIDGKSRTMSVHMTVARAFLGDPQGRQIRHLNGIKTDNRIENLAYGTPKQNQNDRRKRGYQGSKLLTEQQKLDIRSKSGKGRTTKSLANEYKVDYNTIHAVLDIGQLEVNRDLLWRCVKTGAGISVIAKYLGVTHGAVSLTLKRQFKPMRELRREFPLNKSLTVGELQRLIGF